MLRDEPVPARLARAWRPLTEAEIDATVAAAVTTFVKAYAPG